MYNRAHINLQQLDSLDADLNSLKHQFDLHFCGMEPVRGIEVSWLVRFVNFLRHLILRNLYAGKLIVCSLCFKDYVVV